MRKGLEIASIPSVGPSRPEDSGKPERQHDDERLRRVNASFANRTPERECATLPNPGRAKARPFANMTWYGKAWISWIGSHGLSDGAQPGARRPPGGCLVAHRQQSAAACFGGKSDRLRLAETGGRTGGLYLRLRRRHPYVGRGVHRSGRCHRGAKAGTVAADASTISPSASRAIGEKLAAKGIQFLDAPCTGSTPGAINATLTFMIGGDQGVFEKTKPFLEAMGKKFYYCGGPGWACRPSSHRT